MLFDYEELIGYFQKLDAASDRLLMKEIGHTPEGRPMYIAFISTPENLERLDELKEINRELALNHSLGKDILESYIQRGRVFVLATLSMHSTEVGPSQAAPLLAYDLAGTRDERKLSYLEEVVYMLVPCHNPDGMNMVVHYYNKTKGTENEGTSLPRVYHKYVGHDNNRDFITLTQEDNKAIARIYNLDWFPQVMVEKHQMGSTGPRYFVPPNHDPIAENVAAGIWNWTGLFGMNMIKDMTREGLQGISQHYIFDDYWPGSTETCIWKNVIGFLTEAASARLATPVYIEPTELKVHGKGLSEYKKSINMPEPWPGGWWKLSDIIQLELESNLSILKTAALHKEDILRFRNRICRDEVKRGMTQAPYYYIMPRKQHDKSELVKLVRLLQEHGVEVYTLRMPWTINGYQYAEGDIVVPMNQPFRPFIKEVLEDQEFPVRHYTPDGEIIKPYDIASWSLPLHNGVDCREINNPVPDFSGVISRLEAPWDPGYELYYEDEQYAVFSANHNESYEAVFRLLAEGFEVKRTLFDAYETGYDNGEFQVTVNDKNRDKFLGIVAGLDIKPTGIVNSRVPVETLSLPRVGLIETIFHDMDAGWTRYVFDRYHIPCTVLKPEDLKTEDLRKEYDVLVFPDVHKSLLMSGKIERGEGSYYITNYPPELTRGMEKEGLQNLLLFIDSGGKVLSWGRSAGLFEGSLSFQESKDDKKEFMLPFNDVSDQLRKKGLYVPGSLMEVKLLQGHKLTFGMPSKTGVFFRGRPVFETRVPSFDMDRRIIATTPEKEILLSGYAEKEELVGHKALMLWIKKGEGELVLYGFNPQFRSSTHATFKLLFNGLLL